jgi:glycosyltransferase involved in cell wall biosynthesis
VAGFSSRRARRSTLLRNAQPIGLVDMSGLARDQKLDRGRASSKISRPKLSVVVPAYNEQNTLGELHRRLTKTSEAAVGASYEIVIVDDGSTDQTWLELEKLSAQDEHILAVKLSRNHGHQLALTAGLSLSEGERILIIDADLQDPPELLPKMMQLMDEGAEVVYGLRLERVGESRFKLLSASLFYRFLDFLADSRIPRDTGDFRLLSRCALDVLNSMPEQQRFLRGMVSWIGMKQVPICYRRQPRFAGGSNYPLRKMVRLAVDAVTSFSMRPLRLASLLGAIFASLAFLGMVWVAATWLLGKSVQGWASLSVMILVLGSAQLLVLGIMGEYLGRLFIEAKHRPLFVIERICKASTTELGACGQERRDQIAVAE